MNDIRISAFLLERYHIGEVTDKEKRFVEEAAAKDEITAAELADLFRADIDFRRQFPRDVFFSSDKKFQNNISKQTDIKTRHDQRSIQRSVRHRQLKRIPSALVWG